MDNYPHPDVIFPHNGQWRIQRRIEILLDEADEAVAISDWAVVHDRAQNVLRFDPENKDALSYLAAAERDLQGVIGSESPRTRVPENQADTPPTELQPTPLAVPEAERRQLTVMFCDLQGSTALSQQLDPEELREVIRSYQDVCAGAVARFEGHIAKYLGDGLLVYFGYPQAHEDDPQRAVRAGLAIVQDMDGLNARLNADKDIQLAIRIGVHTGLVVAGEMGGGDTVEALAIVGETPNIAARLQEVAEPNSVVISDITADLVQGFFLYQALGFHDLKGTSQPMELFAVLSESGAQTRFDIAAATRLTPLIGREQEVGLVLDRWEQVNEGLGQVVLLSGEAGIGKSRLIEAVTERLAKEPYTLRRLRCSAYHQNSALQPLLEYMEGWLAFAREDSAEERLGKLEGALAKVDFPLSEAVSLLSGLLSVPLAERYPALAKFPEMQLERTRELLVTLLLDTAEDQPVFLVVEDLQWADPSTLAMLGLLVDQVPTAKILALLSFRPEFTPPWTSRAYVTPIMLSRLTRRLAGEMVGQLTGGKKLPEEVLGQIAAKSDGAPIFVEELSRMLLESDLLKEVDDHYELTGPLTPLSIPSTLQDSLTARLDRLTSAREVAQLGAVLGREFTYELLKAVSPLEESLLGSHLQQLVNAEFLYQRGLPPDAIYTFKHALIQDAACESLLRSRRQQYHQRTALVLEEGSAGIVETQPELLAHHFAEAGLTDKAVSYWQQAGERALSTYAWEEAQVHFERSLVARGTPLSGAEPVSDGETAALLFGLGRSRLARGQSLDQAREAIGNLTLAFDYYAAAGDVARAVAIAEYPLSTGAGMAVAEVQFVARALKMVPQDSYEAGRLLARAGWDLGRTGADYDSANEAFERALTIARREGDLFLEMETLTAAAEVDLFHLRVKECYNKARQALELAQRVDNPRAEVQAHARAIFALTISGDREGARAHASAGLGLAERLRQSFWITTTVWGNQMVSQLVGDWETARDFGARGLAVEPDDLRILGNRVVLEHEVGSDEQGKVYLQSLLQIAPGRTGPGTAAGTLPLVFPLVARVTGRAEGLAAAQAASETLLSSPSTPLLLATMARTGLALLAVIADDVPAAREQYAGLESQRGTMVPNCAACCVDRVLGLLAQTMGNLDQAAAHFKDALAFCRKAGYRPELAWTCCDYADLLRERDGEGDRAKAMSLLDESLVISSELGMRPLMERVLSRRNPGVGATEGANGERR